MNSDEPSRTLDVTVAHPARRYNYWLGGKDNFAADRASADAIEKIYPGIRTAAVENRRFLHRAVRYLVQVEGVRQFLDVGTGLPTADNTHEVAQRYDPTARVLYVDNDPLVLVHARALLISYPAGATAYLDADLRQPDTILAAPKLHDTLDLTRPVAVLLVAVLHFLPDHEQAYDVVQTLMAAMPAGSYLVISHATTDALPADTARRLAACDLPGRGDFTARTCAQVARFFDGLTLIDPGLHVISAWRPDPRHPQPPAEQVAAYGGIAHKPAPCPCPRGNIAERRENGHRP
jgi:trans-aconitate methyltransferase